MLGSAWVDDGGTLYTASSAELLIRAPDGTWSSQPAPPGALTGSGDTLWAWDRDAVQRQAPDGSWADMGLPAQDADLADFRLLGPDDAVALWRLPEGTWGDCYYDCPPRTDDLVLARWDGQGWTEQRLVEPAPVRAVDGLPDGRLILLAGDTLQIADGTDTPIPTPTDHHPTGLFAASDGTLVTWGWDGLAVGDLTGLSEVPIGPTLSWIDAWASGADDIWVLGRQWSGSTVASTSLFHFDGVQWRTAVDQGPPGITRIASDGVHVFAVGGDFHEQVWMGDRSGIAIERESFDVAGIREMVTDDLTETTWSVDAGWILGRWDGAAWTGVPLPDTAVRAEAIAASGDRVGLLKPHDTLYVFEDGVVRATPTPDAHLAAIAAADGVIYAAGPSPDPSSPPIVWRESGSGWEAIDTAALPVDADAHWLVADGPDLWLGFDLSDERGAVAHWDGAGWAPPVSLPHRLGWMERLPDGRLYVASFDADQGGLWVVEGDQVSRVSDALPGVRAAWLLDDGTRYQWAPVDEQMQLFERRPGLPWQPIDAPYLHDSPFRGDGARVWTPGSDRLAVFTICD